MKDQTISAIKLIEALTERAKELTCLYAIEELLKKPDTDIAHVCSGIIESIPPGWQYPEICQARIVLHEKVFQSLRFEESPWMLSADVVMQDETVGNVSVYYTREKPDVDHGPFLKEEKKLIETIADRLGHFLLYKKMEQVVVEWKAASLNLADNHRRDWETVLDLLRQTDNSLFLSIANKMLNHLCWSGIRQAENLRRYKTSPQKKANGYNEEAGRQHPSRVLDFSTEIIERIFQIAGAHLSGDEILSRIQMWIHEDRLSALVQIVQRHLPISEVCEALRRYYCTSSEEEDARYPVSRGLKVSLIRRVLSDRLDYINLAKKHVGIEDLFHLLQKVIFSPDSRGGLGALSAEYYLATQIVEKAREDSDAFSNVRFPKTWYISSDMMLHFMHYNNIDEVIEQKYKELDRVRLEYPHIVQTFTSAVFPPEMVKGLSVALDDFSGKPLIIKSSSNLDHHLDPSFFTEGKTVFVANQGPKHARLDELMNAVAEVYASAFSPDLIERRAERSLLDFSEETGIMIQEAVGTQIGDYFLPAFSGVALSRNDFRWSPSLKREDGLVQIMPGFCTETVNQSRDDYSLLFAPGRPDLKLVATDEEAIRYAPKKIAVIDLKTKFLKKIDVGDFLKDFGD
ncbi:MAG: PEP/pyruvate-binding domain-containing protein, partial [Planctomycetes bacterium]|nr:PEP/pyruvate-binding domain-containing protein [Planctomycetota bacterium]